MMRAKKRLALARVYRLLEPGPVVLLSTARNGRANVMTMSWHTMMEFEPPLVAGCYACLECKVVDARLARKYNFFVLRVLQAWFDASVKRPRTLHHRGLGEFMVAGRTLRLPSKMK